MNTYKIINQAVFNLRMMDFNGFYNYKQTLTWQYKGKKNFAQWSEIHNDPPFW